MNVFSSPSSFDPSLHLLLLLLLAGGVLKGALVEAGRTGGTIAVEQDAAYELNLQNFNSSIWAAPASWALVEFFASWCPACRNYKPHYEQVAKLFNGQSAAHPGVLYVAKVDCAQQANQKLCERFSIGHFPTLLWGKPSKFAWGIRVPNIDSGVEIVETNYKADGLLQWINKRLGKDYKFNDADRESVQSRNLGNSFNQSKTTLVIHDLEEVVAQAYEIILENKMLNQKSRMPFIAFLQLLMLHHPSQRCRKGSAAILTSLEETWPAFSSFKDLDTERPMLDSASIVPNFEDLRKRKICGGGLPKDYWVSCRGSRNGTRGYSCGLWLLFHSLSVRVDDTESLAAFKAIHGFINYFFTCQECKEHFLQMSSRNKMEILSRHDLALWFWHAHNEVNKRLATKEAAHDTGDPEFPKIVWPSKDMCPSCRMPAEFTTLSDEPKWNESVTYSFLLKFYGRILPAATEIEETSTQKGLAHSTLEMEDIASSSSVTVPVRAALCIAMASCGFGIAACYWRMQQKWRK